MRKRIVFTVMAGAIAAGAIVAIVSGRQAAGPQSQTEHSQKLVSPATGKDPVSGAGPPIGVKTAPHFTSAFIPSPAAVVNDPRSKEYDAVKLQEVSGASWRQVFLREPRHPDFAPFVERRLNHYLGHDLKASGAAARILGVECRSRVCEVTLEADDKNAMNVALHALQMTPISNVFSMGAETAPGVRILTYAWEGNERKVTEWLLAYPNLRAKALEEKREIVAGQGLPPGFPPIPPDVDQPDGE